MYLDGAAEDDGRTILVLYTDGGDTRSTIGFGDLMTLIRASDVTVYAVGFLENQSSSVTDRAARAAAPDRRRHRRPGVLPDDDEGRRGGLRQGRRADPRAVQPRLYVHQHEAGRPVAQGGDRVKRPDLKDLRIQTRKGYFAPYKQ